MNYQRFRDQFARLLDPALYPLEWLDLQVSQGIFQLFSTEDSAILVKIERYPSGLLEAHGMAAVGKLPEIIGDLIPQAEAWATAMGCKFARIESREGWVRAMSNYSVYQVTLRRAL